MAKPLGSLSEPRSIRWPATLPDIDSSPVYRMAHALSRKLWEGHWDYYMNQNIVLHLRSHQEPLPETW